PPRCDVRTPAYSSANPREDGPDLIRHSDICPGLRSRLPTDTGFQGNRLPCLGVLIDVTETSSGPSVKRRAFLGVAAGGAAAVAMPGVAQAAVPNPRHPPPARVRAAA